MNADGTLKLSDGRQLGYCDCGDSQGAPLLIFGGWPSSRLFALLYHERMAEAGIRLVGVDRPGIGLSDPQRRRKLLDFPRDISDLLDGLELDMAGVLGVSSGAPYALACAYGIPARLRGCGIVSGLNPLVLSQASGRGLTGLLTSLAGRAPWLMTPLVWWMMGQHGSTEQGARRVTEWMVKNGADPDRLAVEKYALLDALVNQFHEAFRSGSAGVAGDWRVIVGHWGFAPADIRFERMYLWHGELDGSVPVKYARLFVERLPGCKAEYYPSEGHTSTLDNHIEEIAPAVVG